MALASGEYSSGGDVQDSDGRALVNVGAVASGLGFNSTLIPATSGGLTMSRTISAATTNATSVKGSAGQLYGWYVNNVNAAVRYLKFYNKATAPTVGTDTPVLTLALPAGQVIQSHQTAGIAFTTGLAFALTVGVADADTAAVAANELIVNLFYK